MYKLRAIKESFHKKKTFLESDQVLFIESLIDTVISDEQVKVFAVKSCVIVLALVVFNFEGLLETKVIR